MTIRFHNARILTMNAGEEIYLGELHVTDSRITYVGPSATPTPAAPLAAVEFPATAGAESVIDIDCHGNLLMPGFKNAHAHSGMSMLRSLADDKPLHAWLNEDIFPVEARLTGEDIYWASQLSVLEYLTSGITACFDMYMEQEDVARAMDDMGFRCVQTGGVNDFSKDVRWIDYMYNKYNQPGSLQSYQLGFHAEYTTNMDNLKAIGSVVQKNHAPLYVHACETKEEVEGCLQRYGKTPVAFLDSLGFFDYGGGIYHGVHMSEADYEVMQRRGLYVVTNPGSNTKLSSGIAPITEYLRRGIPVAIGTDGPASNNCLDFFREMFLVTGLAKLREHDASALDAREVLTMATVNGARAMHLSECETLSVGQKADIIMLDLWQPNMQPLNNIAKNIVYSGSKQNVCMTMIDGRILYQNGKFANGIDPATIYRKVEEIKQRVIVPAE
ncbi:MAG: amidohydrolase [Prevotella sp.]|nr:amidohydrolase [Prevotella sp.]